MRNGCIVSTREGTNRNRLALHAFESNTAQCKQRSGQFTQPINRLRGDRGRSCYLKLGLWQASQTDEFLPRMVTRVLWTNRIQF
eukprot:2278429-Amphidinium_carterae.1